ncbi:MAG: 4-hydroxy-tetrahydrodipicolinate reductase [Ruminococcaceae bacterium]|jgi:4-hydroxy-tetrahydrodipicolinate reductase|nr:4-hydroxy-tetrahydrodipicolinate reductase [Oscillospiraceae bacterium]
MVKIIIQGIHGKMGRKLLEMIEQRSDCEVVAGVDKFKAPCVVPVFSSLDECTVSADVMIDFSNPAATDAALSICAAKNLPCVICTTGLSDETLAKLENASKSTAVFKSANMSVGINLLILLAKKANAVLGTDFDIEIIEKHHHNKLDAPSGTALMIADAIKENASGIEYEYVYDRSKVRRKREVKEIGISAVRGGSIVGEHDVMFCGQDEVITLSHSAASRDVFANGAVNAAVYLAGKPAGLYSMEDMLSL